MNRQSKLFEEISLEQIHLLLEKTLDFYGPVKATLLSGGMFNTTYRVTGKEQELDVVLRLGPVNQHLVLRFEENLMEAEAYVYELCKTKNINCSEVLVCDTKRQWIDRDYMIVKYIPSVAMCDAGLTGEQKIPLYVEAGKSAKKLHEITNPTFGRVSEILSGLSYTSWSEYLLSELRDICGRLLRDDGIHPELLARAEGVIEKYRDWLEEIDTPRLIHTDIWEGNILLNKDTKDHIIAIIDSDRAIFGDPDYDLACPWMLNDHFFKGYGIDESAFHKEEFHSVQRVTRRKIYKMMCYFVEAYVGHSEYNRPDLHTGRLQDCRDIILELEKQ